MFRTPLGDAVKSARLKKYGSQRSFARITGFPAGTTSRIESDGFVPNIETIKLLASKLAIPKEELLMLARQTKGKLNVFSEYTNLEEIIQRAFFSMTEEELRNTLQRIDRRIGLFREDKDALSYNLKEFLLGRLTLDGKPENGLRPLTHYVFRWSGEIEEWESE